MKAKIKTHLRKHFSAYMVITNILCAVCVAAFAVLGLLSDIMSTSMLIGNGILFGVIYAISKFGDETLDDLGQECHHND